MNDSSNKRTLASELNEDFYRITPKYQNLKILS